MVPSAAADELPETIVLVSVIGPVSYTPLLEMPPPPTPIVPPAMAVASAVFAVMVLF